jgi:hypothetical protein
LAIFIKFRKNRLWERILILWYDDRKHLFDIGRPIIPAQISARDYLNFLRTILNGILEDVPIKSSYMISIWRSSTILQYCSESVALRKLSWTLYWSRTLSSNSLTCRITWLQSSLLYFLLGYLKAKVYVSTVDTGEEPWFRIQQLASQIKKTFGIFERLQISFSFRAKLYARKKFINSSFVCFLLIHNPLT